MALKTLSVFTRLSRPERVEDVPEKGRDVERDEPSSSCFVAASSAVSGNNVLLLLLCREGENVVVFGWESASRLSRLPVKARSVVRDVPGRLCCGEGKTFSPFQVERRRRPFLYVSVPLPVAESGPEVARSLGGRRGLI